MGTTRRSASDVKDAAINQTAGSTCWLGLHNVDARRISEVIPPASVDLILTSPPYADMKDYGYSGQIGYGQELKNYLEDMRGVFAACHKIAKQHATMWMVVDTFKKNGQLVDLPSELSRQATQAGWLLQDIVIWHKTKTLPWSHRGRLRNIFEHILVFSKSRKYKYHPERIRETDDLRQWWPKYPERYSPTGKTPHNIWYFPIPTQGSWGNGVLRHFNPFPPALVERIIDLTTDPGDVVFDSFAGSGTVLAQAESMGRRAVGFELNPTFSEELFPKMREEIRKRWDRNQGQREARRRRAEKFESLIMRLRKIKLAKQLVRSLALLLARAPYQDGEEIVAALLLDDTNGDGEKLPRHTIASVNILLIVSSTVDLDAFLSQAREFCDRPPLSKYGIQARIDCVTKAGVFEAPAANYLADGTLWFGYPAGTTHIQAGTLETNRVIDFCTEGGKGKWIRQGLPPVFSDISVDEVEINEFLH